MLVLGGMIVAAMNGDPNPVADNLLDTGDLDHVHVRSSWLDFSVQ